MTTGDPRAADDRVAAAATHVATPENITPCGRGCRDVTCEATIDEVTCVECLRAIVLERGLEMADRIRELEEDARGLREDRQRLHHELRAKAEALEAARDEIDDAADTGLAARVSQLEHDMSAMERSRDQLLSRVDALETAQRKPTVEEPEPCPVTGRHPTIPAMDMGCAHDAGHLSPHYNPSEGGWTWDDGGANVTNIGGF